MGIMVYSLLGVMQDFVHQPYLAPRLHPGELLRAHVHPDAAVNLRTEVSVRRSLDFRGFLNGW